MNSLEQSAALNRHSPASGGSASDRDRLKAKMDGACAALEGRKLDANQYPEESELHFEWLAGWTSAKAMSSEPTDPAPKVGSSAGFACPFCGAEFLHYRPSIAALAPRHGDCAAFGCGTWVLLKSDGAGQRAFHVLSNKAHYRSIECRKAND